MAYCTNCGATITGAFCTVCGTRVNTGAASSAAPAGQPSVAPPPASSAPAAAPPPYDAPARKTSPLVWVAVVVLALFMLFGIGIFGVGWFAVHKMHQAGVDPELWRRNPALAAGRIIAATNPDLQVLRTDDNAGTLTVRNRRTGKETTVTFEQARQGHITFETEDDQGKTARVEIGASGKPPAWVPEYPGSHSTYSIKGAADSGEEGGNVTYTTSDPASKVMAFYQDKAKDLGMDAKVTTASADGGVLVATREDDQRSLTVIVGTSGGQTTVNVTYARKR